MKYDEMSNEIKEYIKGSDVFGIDDNNHVTDIENEIVDEDQIKEYIEYRIEAMNDLIEGAMKRYWDMYFDDLEGHIQLLENEMSLLEDCIKKDELHERITHLKSRLLAGDLWIDNDITASPDKWKSLETFTEKEAVKKYHEWND